MLLLLSSNDNVLIARARLPAGTEVVLDSGPVILPADLPIGHKLARHAIPAGTKIIKYGAPIGIATKDIPPGAHVHVHNIRSDYTPTYTLDSARQGAEK